MFFSFILLLPFFYVLSIYFYKNEIKQNMDWLRNYKNEYNTFMVISSIINFICMIITCIENKKFDDIYGFFCNQIEINSIYSKLAIYIFFISKYIEWIDTIFLILENKSITFLHIFHHSTTCIMTYLNTYPRLSSFWPIPCLLNTFVHTLMYLYFNGYFRKYKSIITLIQTTQHLIASLCALYMLTYYSNDNQCYFSIIPIYFGLFGYIVYFIFFTKLLFNNFTNNYINICFYIFFNFIVFYSIYITKNYDEIKLSIIFSMIIYETYNFLSSLNDSLLMKSHHLLASIALCCIYYYYDNIYDDAIWCAILLLLSNLPKNLLEFFPNSLVLKIIWFIEFFYFRIYCIFPYFIKVIQNKYSYVNIIVKISAIIFYLLSFYWFILMSIYIYKQILLKKKKFFFIQI